MILAKSIEVAAGATIYDGLEKVCGSENIKLVKKGSGAFIYILEIDNLAERQHGPLSGWVYAVDGVYATKGLGGVKLEPGGEIWLYYSQDMGMDFISELDYN